jgi:hypothetical protein
MCHEKRSESEELLLLPLVDGRREEEEKKTFTNFDPYSSSYIRMRKTSFV